MAQTLPYLLSLQLVAAGAVMARLTVTKTATPVVQVVAVEVLLV
jgi:hypothetical protein